MLYIITAIRWEALPLIRRLHLKKDASAHPFPVYRNDDTCLIISGTGKMRAAIATTFLLSTYGADHATVLNIGVCGAIPTESASATDKDTQLYQAGKITDADTGRDYFPDLSLSLPPRPLLCTGAPVDAEVLLSMSVQDPNTLIDMESAGVIAAASVFVDAHRIVVLKIISDFCEPNSVSASDISACMETALEELRIVLPQIQNLSVSEDDDLFVVLEDFRQWAVDCRFTKTMQSLLMSDLKNAYACGKDTKLLLDQMRCFSESARREKEDESTSVPQTKQEGKRIFAYARQLLRDS